jgi:hypothetical protein
MMFNLIHHWHDPWSSHRKLFQMCHGKITYSNCANFTRLQETFKDFPRLVQIASSIHCQAIILVNWEKRVTAIWLKWDRPTLFSLIKRDVTAACTYPHSRVVISAATHQDHFQEVLVVIWYSTPDFQSEDVG